MSRVILEPPSTNAAERAGQPILQASWECDATNAMSPIAVRPNGGAPYFSIITSTLNVLSALRRTADSLAQQTCRDFDWIVIDGASNDGTVEFVEGLDRLVTEFVSEPDSGIYDAWNKALPRIRGEWVLFLGAGDLLYRADVLEKAFVALEQLPPEITTACGDVTVFDAASDIDGKILNGVFQGVNGPWVSGRPILPCHQGVFQRGRVFETFRFDKRCRISADNETLLRELLDHRGIKLDLMVARFAAGGTSARSQHRLRMIAESIYINWKLGIFHKRPIYQIGLLVVNAVRHILGLQG